MSANKKENQSSAGHVSILKKPVVLAKSISVVLAAGVGSYVAWAAVNEFIGGTSWNAAGNWSLNQTPSLTDTVTFDHGVLLQEPGVVTLDNSFTVAGLNFSTGIDSFNIDANAAGTSTSRTLTLAGSGDLITLGATNTGTVNIGVDSGVGTLTVALAASGNFNLGAGTGSLIFGANSVITGAFSLSQSGSGTLTLAGANTFGGSGNSFTLNGGTLNINNASALGSAGNNFVINGGTLDNTSGASLTTANYTQTWGGSFAFGGTQALNLGTGAVAVSGNTAISINGPASLTVGGVIAFGANGLTVGGTGTGPLILTGANTGTGSVTINTGATLQLGNQTASGALPTGALTVNGTLILEPSSTAATTLSNAITGSGAIVLNGNAASLPSSVTLSGANSGFTGSYTLNQGRLGVASQAALGAVTDPIAINSGGQLFVTAAVTLANPLTIGGTGPLETAGNLGALRLSGATLSGPITLNGNAEITAYSSTGTLTGLISGAAGNALTFGGPTGALSTITVNGTVPNTYAGGTNIVNAAVTAASAGALGTGPVSIVAGARNTTLTLGAAGALLPGQNVTIASTGAFTSTLALGTFSNGIGSLTLGGSASVSSVATITGTGTLTLNGDVTYNGGASNPGPASISTPLTLAANRSFTVYSSTNSGGKDLTVSGGVSGSGTALTKLGNGTLILSGASTYTGATTVAAGTLQLTTEAALYNNTPASWTASNITVNSGATLSLGVGAGQFTSADLGILLSLGTATGGFQSGSTVGIDTTGSSFSYAGVIANPNGGANVLGLTKLGPNTLILAGANSYSGPTTIAGGTLSLTPGGAIGSGALTFSGAATLDLGGNVQSTGAVTLAATAGGIAVQNGTMTGASYTSANGSGYNVIGANLQGSGALAQTGAGTLILTGTNSYAGGTTVSAGVLQLGDGFVSSGSVSGNIVNNAALIFANPGAVTYGGVISGSGSVTKSGAGTLTLTGASTYAGSTTLNAGILTIAGSLPSVSAVTFGGSSTLNFQGTATGSSQALGAVAFNAGDAAVQVTAGNTGVTTLTFGSVAARSLGATSNFVVTPGVGGGTGRIVLTGLPVNSFVDQGTFFGGSSYAWNDAGGFVRALNYSADAEAATFSSGANNFPASGTLHVQITGDQFGQNSATISDLNFNANSALTMADSQTLTVNGILVSGNVAGGATITGGTGIQAATGAELVIRTDGPNDQLTISTPILGNGSNALTKSGAGTLILPSGNTFTGQTYIDGGILSIGANSALGAPASGATLNLNGGTLQTTAGFGLFNGTSGTNNRAVVVGPAGGTFNTKTGTLTIAGTVTSLGNIVKTGSGGLTINKQIVTSNSTIDIQAGTFSFDNSGTATNLASGGNVTLQAESGTVVSLVQTESFGYGAARNWSLGTNLNLNGATLNGGGTVGALFERLLNTTTMHLSGANTIAQVGGSYSQNFAIDSTLTGSGSLNLNRANASFLRILNLKGDMAGYSGDVSVGTSTASTGYVVFGNASGWGSGKLTLTGAGSNVLIGDEVATVYNSAWTGGSALGFTAGTLAATGAVTVGQGAKLLINNGSTYGILFEPHGGLTVDGGTLGFGANGAVVAAGTTTGGSAFVPYTGTTWTFDTALSTVSANIKLNYAGATFQVADAVAGTAVDTVISGNISGANDLTKTGAGTLLFTGGNTYAGPTTISNGTLQVGSGGTSGSLGAGVVTNSGALVFNRSDSIVVANTISGSGSLTHAGTGSITLMGPTSYTGATAVTGGGTLVLGANANLASNSISIGAGGVLDASGLISGSLSIGPSQTLTAGRTSGFANDIIGNVTSGGILNIAGVGVAGTLTLAGNLALSGGTLNFDLSGATTAGGGVNDLLSVGNLSLTGTTNIAVDILGGSLANGTYTLINYAGALTGGVANLSVSGASGSTRQSYTFGTTGGSNGSITLTVAGSVGNLTWVGDNVANAWDVGTTANFMNGGSLDKFYNGDMVTFDDSGAPSVSITGVVQPGSVTVNTSQSYTFGGAGSIAGGSGLTKIGAGTLTINNTNSFTGPVTISQGIVSVGTIADGGLNSPLGAGTSIVLGDSGTNTGDLQYTGVTASSNRALSVNSGGGIIEVTTQGTNLSLGGALSGSGPLTLQGLGTVTLSGANTFGGTITIGGGGLILGNALALQNATLNYSNAGGALSFGLLTSATLGGLQGNQNLVLQNAAATPAAVALSVGGNGGTTTYSGILSGPGSLTKIGNGYLTLSGANTYTGTTTVSAGTLEVKAKSGDVPYVVAQGATLKLGYSTGGGYSPSITVNGSGLDNPAGLYLLGGKTIQTNGGLVLQTAPTTVQTYGTGNATLQGFDTNSSYFLYSTAAASGSTLAPTININTGQYGYVVQTDVGTNTATGDLTINGVIGGTGGAGTHGLPISAGLIKVGAGSLKLTGASTYSNATGITNGSIILSGANNRLPIGTRVVLGGGTASGQLVLGDAAGPVNQTIAGLQTNGTGTSNSVVGGSSTVSTLTINNSVALSYGGSLGGYGTNQNNLAITKTGNGTLTLSGTTSYTGPTNINGGTLALTGSASLASAAINVASGGVLDVSGIGGGYFQIGAGQTLTAGRGSAFANDIVGNVGSVGTINVAGLGVTGTLTVSGDLTLNGGVVAFDLAPSTIADGSTNDLINATNLNLNAPTSIAANALGGALAGTYTLMNYSGALTGDTGSLSVLGAAFTRQTFTFGSTGLNNGSLTLTVSGNVGDLKWSGDGSANVWDLVTTSNFSNSGSADKFYNGDHVIFDDTGSAAPLVAIAGNIQPGSVSVNASQNYTFGGTGSIVGGTGLIKGGTGTLTITNTNSFSGPVAINQGIVSVGAVADGGVSSPLGAGTVISLGDSGTNVGTLQFTGILGSSNRALTLNPGGGVVEVTNAGSALTIGGVISGTGSLTTQGAGSVTLKAANTFTGTTTIAAGSMTLGNAQALQNSTLNYISSGGTLNFGSLTSATFGGLQGDQNLLLQNQNATPGAVALSVGNNGANTTYSGVLSGPGSFTKVGNGYLTLTGANTYTGMTNVLAGTLEVQAKSGDVAYVVAQGATLKMGYSTGGGYTPSITVNGNGVSDPAGLYLLGGTTVQSNDGIVLQTAPTTIQTYGTGSATLQGFDVNSPYFLYSAGSASGSVLASTVNINTGVYGYKIQTDLGGNTATGDLTINGIITGTGNANVGFSIATGLLKFGAGSLTLTGASTYSAATGIGEGSIILSGSDNRLPVGTTVILGSGSSSGTLVLGDANGPVNQTIAGLQSAGYEFFDTVAGGSASISTLTLNNTGVSTYNGALGGYGENQNNLALIVNGPGTFNYGGTATYTGNTTINGGTVMVSGSLAGKVVVNGGTLGGNGTINNNVTLGTGLGVAGSAILAPSAGGAGVPQTLQINGSVLMNSDAVFQLQLDSGSSVSDELMITGTLTLNGSILSGADLGSTSLNLGTQFMIAEAQGGIVGSFANVPQGADLLIGSNLFAVNYTANSGTAIVLTVVPEPDVYSGVMSGMALLLGLQRFRRRIA